MITYEPRIGSHITTVLKEMKQMAIENNCHVKANFNEIELIINKDSDLDKALEAFHAEQDRKAEEYRNSPEGIAAQVEYESEYAEQMLKVDTLLKNLPDFNSLKSVIQWFGEFKKCSMITLQSRGIVELFEEKGYYAGVNCGDDFTETDKDNWARWLIGQSLECIRDVGTICPMYSQFENTWMEKFEGE